MWILTDIFGSNVVHNKGYKSIDEAKDNLEAEFNYFTDENNIKYGVHCLQNDDGMSAWARFEGKYRVWNIIKVLD